MEKFESPLIEEDYAQTPDKALEKGEDMLQKFVFDFKSEEKGRDYEKAHNNKKVQNICPRECRTKKLKRQKNSYEHFN
jgi:hypothetical protein